ncbi:MAG: lipoate--protein ligase family protein [Elusimicrobia bacterium]|jgi:lipoate-protein ligase A|nr:lipoate--protein ligase family protein [Elusimicrobiota bacterium]
MKKWRVIISGGMAPAENMETDYALWRSASNGKSVPVLRFYQWSPSAVSLGYNQSPQNIINTDFCKEKNIPVVKRPTGGSAIFHDIELTYSFCGNIKDHPSFALPFASYIAVCRGIINGLQRLGIGAGIRGISESKEPSYTTRDCFSLSSRHDIVANGKKIVGSAQRRNKDAFLQHGSILIDINRELWDNIFTEKTDFSKINTLKELLEDGIAVHTLIAYIKEGFGEAFEVCFEESVLTAEEKSRDERSQ